MRTKTTVRQSANRTEMAWICFLMIMFTACILPAIATEKAITLHPFVLGKHMPTAQVRQVYEDHEGIKWMPTFRGLVRYSDQTLRTYRSNLYSPELLPCNNVICVCEDRRQRLWIGTERGLCRLDKNTGRVVQMLRGKGTWPRVNELLAASNGTVYAGMIRGLQRYDESSNQMVKVGLEGTNIQSMAEMPNGDILIGTWGKGLFSYSTNKGISAVPLTGDIVSKTILALHISHDGTIWAGTLNEGLCQLRKGKNGVWQIATQYAGSNIPSDCVYSIAESNGTLLAGTRKGLFVEQGACMLGGEEVLGVCVDGSGHIWAATKGSGVYTTSEEECEQSGKEKTATQVLTDRQNGRWRALNYGVEYTSAAATQSVTLLPALRPYRLSLTSNGRVLIPMHDDGLYVAYQGRIEQHLCRRNSGSFMPHDLVHHALEDSKGNLWVATRQGIGVRHADGQGCVLHRQPGAPDFLSEEIYFLSEDKQGTIWAATNDGMIRCDSTFRRYSLEDGNFPIGHPLVFCQDKAGRRWVGTDGMGLCLYDSIRDCFLSVHEQLQLPGDVVTEVEAGEDGSLTITAGTETIRLTHQELESMHRQKQEDQSRRFLWVLLAAVGIGAGIAIRRYRQRKGRDRQTETPAASPQTPKLQTVPDQRQQFIDKATAVVTAHLADCNFDVPQLAEELSTSRSTLHRYMKELTGKTTTTFIRDLRMQEAGRILAADRNIRISELAYRVGFNDPKYFSRCFKDTFGVLPSEYTGEATIH